MTGGIHQRRNYKSSPDTIADTLDLYTNAQHAYSRVTYQNVSLHTLDVS